MKLQKTRQQNALPKDTARDFARFEKLLTNIASGTGRSDGEVTYWFPNKDRADTTNDLYRYLQKIMTAFNKSIGAPNPSIVPSKSADRFLERYDLPYPKYGYKDQAYREAGGLTLENLHKGIGDDFFQLDIMVFDKNEKDNVVDYLTTSGHKPLKMEYQTIFGKSYDGKLGLSEFKTLYDLVKTAPKGERSIFNDETDPGWHDYMNSSDYVGATTHLALWRSIADFLKNDERLKRLEWGPDKIETPKKKDNESEKISANPTEKEGYINIPVYIATEKSRDDLRTNNKEKEYDYERMPAYREVVHYMRKYRK